MRQRFAAVDATAGEVRKHFSLAAARKVDVVRAFHGVGGVEQAVCCGEAHHSAILLAAGEERTHFAPVFRGRIDARRGFKVAGEDVEKPLLPVPYNAVNVAHRAKRE